MIQFKMLLRSYKGLQILRLVQPGILLQKCIECHRGLSAGCKIWRINRLKDTDQNIITKIDKLHHIGAITNHTHNGCTSCELELQLDDVLTSLSGNQSGARR